jgi:Nucleotidyl transferase AbiEii toxin, Type IV TA system
VTNPGYFIQTFGYPRRQVGSIGCKVAPPGNGVIRTDPWMLIPRHCCRAVILSARPMVDKAIRAEHLLATCAGTFREADQGSQNNRTSIEVSRIKEDADYEGVRVQLHATLARARIPMQLDIGFGDVITPGPTDIEYPSLLDFPAPMLRAYPKETVVAEKLEALTALGLLNSRMKDFYDLALLSRMYPFEGERLVNAISATFRHRVTTVEAEPIGLTQAYCDDPARAIQWRAFVRRSRFSEESGELVRLVTEIRQFALPMLSAIAAGNPFKALWKPGGPWG